MKIIDCAQGTTEWLHARAGVVTASEFGQIVTTDFELRTGEMLKTYLHKKLAEKLMGRPLQAVSNFGDLEQGTIKEEEALPFYELEHNVTLRRVGFITTEDGRAGCSPDALLDEGGLEIKCPAEHTHVGYLLAGGLPAAYSAQVHFSMFVTGAPWWKFMSYSRNFRPLILTVQRDEKIQEAIGRALAEFLKRFDAGLMKLGAAQFADVL